MYLAYVRAAIRFPTILSDVMSLHASPTMGKSDISIVSGSELAMRLNEDHFVLRLILGSR